MRTKKPSERWCWRAEVAFGGVVGFRRLVPDCVEIGSDEAVLEQSEFSDHGVC